MNFTSSDLKDLQDETVPIVRTAGEYILKYWNKINNISYKDKRDVATNVDVEVEEMMREKLKKIFPEAGFIVEEGKTEKELVYNWCIDPIDGTKNYANRLPMFSTQIALVKKNDSVLGHVFNPCSNQFFSASLGNGSFLNNQKVIAYVRSDPRECILDIDVRGFDNDTLWKLKIFSKLARKFYRVRLAGGFMMVYIIIGGIDGFLTLDRGVKLVDLLPGEIIIKEAGLKAEFVKLENNRKIFIAANQSLFQLLKTEIAI